MASVSVHTTMSLDGFSVGPDDEMGWVFEHAVDVPVALVDDVIATTGAVLGGRRGDEVGRRAERREISKPSGGVGADRYSSSRTRRRTTRATRRIPSCRAMSANVVATALA